MDKDLDLLRFQQLCNPRWLQPVACHMQSCLEDQLQQMHVPRFFRDLAACKESQHEHCLLEALSRLVHVVDCHTAIIDAVSKAACRHTGPEHVRCLSRVKTVRDAYLSGVAAMLLPSHSVSLHEVWRSPDNNLPVAQTCVALRCFGRMDGILNICSPLRASLIVCVHILHACLTCNIVSSLRWRLSHVHLSAHMCM
jgi:hypothetical protein